jgi:hypothetical protein
MTTGQPPSGELPRRQQPRRRYATITGNRRGWPLFFIGLGFLAFGVIIDAISFTSASGGGTYFLLWSPIIIGIVAMVRGIRDVVRSRGVAQAGAAGGAGAQSGGYGAWGAYAPQPGAQGGGAYGAQGGGYGAQGGGYGSQGGGYGAQPSGGHGAQQASGSPQPGTSYHPQPLPADMVGSGSGSYDGPGFALPRSHDQGSPGLGSPGLQPAGAGAAAPVPAAAALPPANWYPDPQNAQQLRWWDGQAWTSHTHARS